MKNKLLKNYKTITSFVLALLIVFPSFPFIAAAQAVAIPTATVTIGSQSASSGSTINVPITASNFADVAGITLTGIQFDNTLLSYTGYTLNALPVSGSLVNLVGNQVNINWSDLANPLNISNSTLLTLNFTVISAITTNANLTFVGTKEINNSLADPISTSFVNGVISLNPVATLSSIAITTPAIKLSYFVGEPLDITGLVVTGTYSDASTKVETITTANITGFNGSAPATGQILTITVEGKTTTYTVDIVAVPVVLNSIAITTPANKLTYTVGDALDITGLVVTGTYSDASTKVEAITVDNISGFNSSAPIAGQILTITISGKTATYTINVVAPLSSAKDITSFSFAGLGSGVINEINHTITVSIPFGTSMTALEPTITISTGASVNPNTNVAQDFTSPVTYTVTAEDSSTQVYTITVTTALNPAKAITSFSFAEGVGVINESAKTIAVTVPFATNVTALVPTIAITGASVNPASGVAQDFTNPVIYTVTAADTTTQSYTVTVIVAAPSDLTALTAIITTAQGKHDTAVEGNLPGQYPAPLKANLQTAINTASTITNASAQSVVDAAVITLNSAITTFEAGIVPPDTTLPVITLNGIGVVNIYAGSTYVDAGATALDNIDGDITANIVVVNPISATSTAGAYAITYNVSDTAGNHATEVTRTVNVLAVASSSQLLGDNTTVSAGAPEILVGDNNIASSTITIPESVTNATINLLAITTSAATNTTATIQGAITINAFTTIGAVNVEIPADIQIVAGTSTWNGIINVPQIKENSTVTATPDSGNTATVSSVIEIGFGNILLSFDKAVRIKITGQAGKYAGYSRNGVFTPITNVCSADSQVAGDALAAGGDCKISVGSDLIIWTKHFTNFVTYTQTAIPPADSGGSGGGGGGGGGYVPPTIPTLNKKADINGDNKVDKYDFSLMMANWGKTGSNACDLNNDSKVDKYDFALLMSKWGL